MTNPTICRQLAVLDGQPWGMNNRRLRQCLLWLVIAALILIWLGRYTNVDIRLADSMFDFSKRQFIWRDHWFATVFMHDAMKIALIAFGLALVAILVISFTVVPGLLANDTRRALCVVVAAFMLVPLLISVLKATSNHACPWDLERYGGTAPYLRLFDSLPGHAAAGHCFPAGHASSGLWLAAFAVFWLKERPRLAAAAFATGLLPGAILGWVQQLRGAHFLTHTAWSMWVASLVIAILARALYCQRPTEPTHSAPGLPV